MKRKDAILTKCFHVFCYDCLRTRSESCLFTYFCDRMHSDNSFLSFLFFFVLDMRQDRGSVRNVMLLLELLTITGGWAAISGFSPMSSVTSTCWPRVSYCVSCLSRAEAVHPVRFYSLYFLYVWPLFQLFLLNGVNLIYLLFRLYLS